MVPRGPALWRQIHREEVPRNPKHGEEQNELRLILQQLLLLFPGDTTIMLFDKTFATYIYKQRMKSETSKVVL